MDERTAPDEAGRATDALWPLVAFDTDDVVRVTLLAEEKPVCEVALLVASSDELRAVLLMLPDEPEPRRTDVEATPIPSLRELPDVIALEPQ